MLITHVLQKLHLTGTEWDVYLFATQHLHQILEFLITGQWIVGDVQNLQVGHCLGREIDY